MYNALPALNVDQGSQHAQDEDHVNAGARGNAGARVTVVDFLNSAGTAPPQSPGTFSVSPTPVMVVFRQKAKAHKAKKFGYGALSQVAPHTVLIYGHASTEEAAARAAQAAARLPQLENGDTISIELDLPRCADMRALALAHERAGVHADQVMTDIAYPAGPQHAAANVLTPAQACDGVTGVSQFTYNVPKARRSLLELRLLAHPHIAK